MAKGLFGDMEQWFDEQGSSNKQHSKPKGNLDDAQSIAEALSQVLGGAKVEAIGGGSGFKAFVGDGSMGGGNVKSKIQGLANALLYIGGKLGVKPHCVDAVGKELLVGDALKVPGGDSKVVLSVGYGFANLSRTDDKKVDDGVWFEHEIAKLNFIK